MAADLPAEWDSFTPVQQEIWPLLSKDAQKFVTTISGEMRWDPDRKYASADEVFPKEIKGCDRQLAFDFLYLIAKGHRIPLVSGEGEFLHKRHPMNDRGDAATIQDRCVSVAADGIYQDIRSGAWVKPQHRTVLLLPHTKFYFHHYASLLEGTGKAIAEDTAKSNAILQRTVRMGIPNSKVCNYDTPAWGDEYLIDLGNITNIATANVTFLQNYRKTDEVIINHVIYFIITICKHRQSNTNQHTSI